MPAMTGSRKILVVDDEATIAQTLELIFESRGYEVRVANSAEEAIDIIAGWKPDLAILDVMLPQMNGIELGLVLESNYPECRLLLMSGHPGTAAMLEGAERTGHHFEILAKPVHPSFILDTVATLLPGEKAPPEA
jgi:DNA-binding NtrC family response regulator